MTWRAFILGMLAVIGVSLLDPYTSFNKGYGWNTQGHFPVAAVFLLVVFTVLANLLIKAFRRRAGLRQAELMLIWCMSIVAFSVPSNPMRLGPPMMAAPAYLARRPDIPWKDSALAVAPDTLLLTKNPRSLAAEQFFEGWRGEGRVPWHLWLTPLSRWGTFTAFYFLSVLFLCAILRRQWIERERLQFPLARIPLDFTEGSGGPGLLPPILTNRACVIGVLTATVLRLLQAMPVFFGGSAWRLQVPLKDVLANTPLQHMWFENFSIGWVSLGLAYLIPSDVSLSIWFFYLFGRAELLVASWLGSPIHYGGTYGELMRWHRPGAYLAFTIGTLFMARRHLADVVCKAFGRARTVDDSAEPVAFGVAFWGLAACSVACIVWFAVYGMKVWVAVLFFLLCMCMELVHSRLVAQSGIYTTAPLASGPRLLHSLGFGHVFGPKGAVIAHMQYAFLTGANNSLLGPAAIHAFRIGSVFEKRRRRWLMPALAAALAVALVASCWTAVRQGYANGALNFANVWSMTGNPKNAFDMADRMITTPGAIIQVRWIPFGLGIVLTGFVMFMRARFYWWPIHSVGLLAFSSYTLDRIWMSFMLGWLVKRACLKFGSGKLLRQGRVFFIGFILTDFFLSSVSTVVRTLSDGRIPGF